MAICSKECWQIVCFSLVRWGSIGLSTVWSASRYKNVALSIGVYTLVLAIHILLDVKLMNVNVNSIQLTLDYTIIGLSY